MGYTRNIELNKPFVPNETYGSDGCHEKSRMEFSDQQSLVMSSSRWNPTPEQLLVLEELYRRGTRTPTTEQIQHIATKLRKFGKIEGKNVFYWFQNHKARERQRRRRERETTIASVSDAHEQHNIDVVESIEKKKSGLRRTDDEVMQKKSWASFSTSSKLTEESISVSNGRNSERRTEDLMRATWQAPKTLDVICRASSLNPSNIPYYCFISSPMLSKPDDENLSVINLEEGKEEIQTLELFPLQRENRQKQPIDLTNGSTNVSGATITPIQFFEFIPLKN